MKLYKSYIHDVAQPCVVPFRRFLIDLCLVAFLIVSAVFVKCLFLITDQLRTSSTDLIAEVAALRVSLQLNIKDTNLSLARLQMNSRVLVDRLDNQMTNARIEMTRASQETKQSVEKQGQQMRQTLRDNVTPNTRVFVAPLTKHRNVEAPSPPTLNQKDFVNDSSPSSAAPLPLAVPKPVPFNPKKKPNSLQQLFHLWN